ncbi:nucleotidyltransferase domain-containing protein [Candidatus Bipolaricaulota bacterium]|nr:nucleotidyltransferase domain-containing protein [Candidatus Bipolaricaulota bacterium]
MPVGIEARRARRRELMELARGFVEAAKGTLGPITAWVYGSVARGDFNLWSDVDVLVVAEELPHRPQDRFGLLLEFAPARVEPKGYTVEEFKALLARLDPQLLGALRQRELLADELGLEGELARALARRRRGGRLVAGEGPAPGAA